VVEVPDVAARGEEVGTLAQLLAKPREVLGPQQEVVLVGEDAHLRIRGELRPDRAQVAVGEERARARLVEADPRLAPGVVRQQERVDVLETGVLRRLAESRRAPPPRARRTLEEADQADRRVDCEALGLLPGAMPLRLEQVVDRAAGVLQVPAEHGDVLAQRRRRADAPRGFPEEQGRSDRGADHSNATDIKNACASRGADSHPIERRCLTFRSPRLAQATKRNAPDQPALGPGLRLGSLSGERPNGSFDDGFDGRGGAGSGLRPPAASSISPVVSRPAPGAGLLPLEPGFVAGLPRPVCGTPGFGSFLGSVAMLVFLGSGFGSGSVRSPQRHSPDFASWCSFESQ
jgi:hypothetical protein